MSALRRITLIGVCTLFACESSVTETPLLEGSLSVQVVLPAEQAADVVQGLIYLDDGLGFRTTSISPGGSASFSGLEPGAYNLAIEGMNAQGEIEVFTERRGIRVTAGETTNVQMTTSNFVPSFTAGPGSGTVGETVTLQWTSITGACSYEVQTADNVDFFSPISTTSTTSASASVLLDREGLLFTHVRAVPCFTGSGNARPSDPWIIAVSPPGPADMFIFEGDFQVGPPNTPLPIDPTVLVVDANGLGLPGQQVQWSVVQGGGSVSPTTSTTASDGLARTTWTLGASGHQQIRASVAHLSVIFDADVGSGNPVVARGGTLNLGGGALGMSFLFDISTNPAGDVTVFGPAGWNGGNPLDILTGRRNNMDPSRAFWFDAGVPPVSGTYVVSQPGLVDGSFTINATQTTPVPSITSITLTWNATSGGYDYAVQWTQSAGQRSFLIVLVEDATNAGIADGVVGCCSAGAGGLQLTAGTAYRTEVYPLTSDVRVPPDPLPSQFDASFASQVVTAPPATTAGASGGAEGASQPQLDLSKRPKAVIRPMR